MKSSFTTDLFSVLKSRVVVVLAGILTSIITARYLGPEGNGVFATLTVYPSLLMTVGSLGVRQSAAYYVGQQKFSDDDIYSGVIQIWIFTSFFCVFLCYVLLKFTTKGDYDNTLIALAILPIPFSLFNTYSSGLFLGKNKIKDFNTVNWVPDVVKFFSYILLIIALGLRVSGALIGVLLGYAILTFLVSRKIKSMVTLNWHFDWKIIKGMLGLGVVYAVSLLVINLNYKVDIMLLERLSNEYEVGIYTKGVSIVEHLWDIPTLLSTIVFARSATSKDPVGFSYKVAQLLRVCFAVILVLSVVFYFLSEFLMVSMYGIAFVESASVQKLLLPGILLLTIFKVLNMDMAGKGKPWLAMIAMLPALIINIILNWILDPIYGARGAAIASTISYSLSAILFLFMYSKTASIPLKELIKFRMSDYSFLDNILMKIRKK